MKKTTNEDFVKKIEGRNLVNMDNYINAKTLIKFKCLMDGYEWYAKPNNILNGKGCPKCGIKKTRNSLIKTNKIIEDNGDWVLIDISTKKHPNETAKFDKTDFYNFKRRLYMSNQGYVVVHPENSKKTIKAHRLLNPEWKVTDHKDRDRTNNRRNNLRECSIMQNSHNSICTRSNSGHRGVSYKKDKGKYIAYIGLNLKTIWLGSYKKLEDALEVRKQAEIKYYGEFRQEFVK